jgi:hypothetical protein
MADDDRPGSDRDRDAGEDPTELRPGERTRADEEEATRLRRQAGAEAPGGDGDPPNDDGFPQEEDDEEPTRFRGSPFDESDDDADEDESTVLRPGNVPDDEDPTVASEEATRLRPGETPADDDPTAIGEHGTVDDDDPTVQATGPISDDDPTIPMEGRGQRGHGDDDPTVQGEGGPPPAGGGKRPAAPQRPSGSETASTIGMGTVLKGRFTLEDKLGSGGMGGVFKAVDLVKQEARDRNPHVAVKVLNESFADHPDAFIALQRESSRTQRLSHPNIASVYDFDRDGDVAYMIMELLKGDPLDAHLKANKNGLPRDEARGIIRDIASALAYAHAQGLIHSDFKPGNIFWTDDGTAKVFDFGIARAAATGEDPMVGGGPVDVESLESDDGSDKTLFDAGKLGALTPAYAAIEMFEGRDPAPQDDVYALGIVAYQCLTGKHPFNRQKAPVAEAKGMVPERPEGLTRREWNALRHTLAFRREDRTPDAQAFLDEFFGVTGQAVRAALIGVFGIAAVVAGLYFAGVIGPAQSIEPPEQWVQLETQIADARGGVAEQLDSAQFEYSDEFVAWEGIIRREVGRWTEIASPRVVIGNYPDEQSALDVRRQAFEQAGVALRVLEPDSAAGSWALAAGPWGGENAESRLDAMTSTLDELGLDYRVERDDAAIAQARDDALDVYLEEVERRLPEGEPPAIDIRLDENDNFQLNQEDVAAVNDGIRDVEEARAVLERAGDRFPTRPDDIAATEQQVERIESRWTEALAQANEARTARQNELDRQQRAEETREARQAEREAIYNAKLNGGTVPLVYTGSGETSHVGVMRTFRLQCEQTGRVEQALADFPDLRVSDQRRALAAAGDCMAPKVERYTDDILSTRSAILDVVRSDATPELEPSDYDAIASLGPPDPCSNRGYVGAGRDAFCIDSLEVDGSAPPVVIVPAPQGGSRFGIGKFEVTIDDYNRYCAATGCTPLQGPGRRPATGIGIERARDYLEWLGVQTDRTYRLPTLAEWRHAAGAEGGEADPNRNCYSNVRGVIRGEQLVSVGQGEPNGWGLVNHLGNAEEWVRTDSSLAVAGGAHTDPLAECTLSASESDDGAADPATGFRVLREIGG